MTKQLEVVYESGVLRPLEPLPFSEQQHLVVTVTDELPTPAFNDRRREQEWLRVNGPHYPGQWVAIEGDQLVSQGDSAKAVLQQARAKGIPHPIVMHIPKEPPLPFGGW
jgi:predicted DNA-binding antitoxin AbrB/MazE fold protein